MVSLDIRRYYRTSRTPYPRFCFCVLEWKALSRVTYRLLADKLLEDLRRQSLQHFSSLDRAEEREREGARSPSERGRFFLSSSSPWREHVLPLESRLDRHEGIAWRRLTYTTATDLTTTRHVVVERKVKSTWALRAFGNHGPIPEKPRAPETRKKAKGNARKKLARVRRLVDESGPTKSDRYAVFLSRW